MEVRGSDIRSSRPLLKDIMSNETELQAIVDCCLEDHQVLKHDLQAEIIWSAIKYAKENIDASVEDCIYYGYNEWMK